MKKIKTKQKKAYTPPRVIKISVNLKKLVNTSSGCCGCGGPGCGSYFAAATGGNEEIRLACDAEGA